MDRASLESLLNEGLSLEEIGRRLERHPSTVGYWLGRYGLTATHHARHAARGALDRSALEALVGQGLSIRRIAEEVGVSASTVRHWLKRYGLATAGAKRLSQPSGSHPLRRCPKHGVGRYVLEGRGYYRCARCRAERVSQWRRRKKATLVAEAGGRCALCGYDRHVGALEFHHRDPAAKEFGVAGGGVARSLERLRAEARKCVLLCANCHAEVEAGIADLPPGPAATL